TAAPGKQPPLVNPHPPPGAISVLVAVDTARFRRGLVSVLTTEPDSAVVGEAGDGEEAIRLAGETKPDVVLMDVMMPVATGPQACPRIRATVPEVRIIMLTMSEDEADLFDALKAGA